MNDKGYIDRIIRYCEKISRYMSETETFNDFELNEEKIDAVILNLEQIGETAKKMSVETKSKHPDVNWPSIIGLRNMISHEYEGIKLNIVYEIATKHIPDLADALSTMKKVTEK